MRRRWLLLEAGCGSDSKILLTGICLLLLWIWIHLVIAVGMVTDVSHILVFDNYTVDTNAVNFNATAGDAMVQATATAVSGGTIRQASNVIPSKETMPLTSTIHTKMHKATSLEPEKPRPIIYYSHLRKDQSGWVIMDMLKAHSFAFARNATYGGACGTSRHIEDIRNVLTVSGLGRILQLQCPPEKYNNTKSTNRPIDNGPRHALYHSSMYEKDHEKRFRSLRWKQHIKSQLYVDDEHQQADTLQLTNHQNATTRIVVHIRRRDVTPCCYPSWYVPNNYFGAMIDKYTEEAQRQHPHSSSVQVDIYSQVDSFESWSPFQRHNLHLDGEVGAVWNAILNADYFIGSKSEFSHVPAMFTRAQVVEEFDEWKEFEKESQLVFSNCTNSMIFSCKHKWWQHQRQQQQDTTTKSKKPSGG